MAGGRLSLDVQHAAQGDLGPAPRRARSRPRPGRPRRAPIPARLRADGPNRPRRDRPFPASGTAGSGDPEAGRTRRPAKGMTARATHERKAQARAGKRRITWPGRPRLTRRPSGSAGLRSAIQGNATNRGNGPESGNERRGSASTTGSDARFQGRNEIMGMKFLE